MRRGDLLLSQLIISFLWSKFLPRNGSIVMRMIMILGIIKIRIRMIYFKNDNQHHNTKHPGPATEAPPASEDTIVLLTGGWNGGRLSSSEVFPSTSGCNPPSLPEARDLHTIFTTAEARPRVAACGGHLALSCTILHHLAVMSCYTHMLYM